MPELPEVETVRRGLAPHLQGRRIAGVRVRNPALRWPIPADLDARTREHRIERLDRRGKYLIMRLDAGALILHLGMSGSLRLVPADTPAEKHEHFDLLLDDGQAMRLKDPRRFGAVLWSDAPDRHPLIAHLGVEPLDESFDGDFLYHASRGRRSNIKQLIMDAHCVVGVGNIYANEALFRAGIRPGLAAGRLSRPRCARLAEAIKETLRQAIAAGGSTLRDFVDGHGRPGYFQQSHFVYGRADAPCRVCATPIRMQRHGNRATYFCPHCQTG